MGKKNKDIQRKPLQTYKQSNQQQSSEWQQVAQVAHIDLDLQSIPAYQLLVSENMHLREQLSDLDSRNAKLINLADTRLKTIEILEKENAELRIKVKSLEEQVAILNEDVSELKINKQYCKFIIALQDVNRFDSLERNSHFNKKTISNLIKLRKNRLCSCHYIDDFDRTEYEDDYRTILFHKINNMHPTVKDIFEHRYPGLIDAVKPFIAPILTDPSDDTIEFVEDWWKY